MADEGEATRDRLESFYEYMRPLAIDGNEFAVRGLLRVMAADDPEAEAERVVEELSEAVKAIGALFRQVADALGLEFPRDVSGLSQEEGK